MDELNRTFQELNAIMDRLLGPGGCPWDREQTMKTLRHTVLEETCELIEAIDCSDDAHICEELGDLILNAVFLGKLAEKEGRFTLQEAIAKLSEKLIRRHPHIFGEETAETAEDVRYHWNRVKDAEKKETSSVLDSLPKTLPGLIRAQKAIKRMRRHQFSGLPSTASPLFDSEEELGEQLLAIVDRANEKGWDAEIALRNRLAHIERAFRVEESKR